VDYDVPPSHVRASEHDAILSAVFAYQLGHQRPACGAHATEPEIFCFRADTGDPGDEMITKLRAQDKGARNATACVRGANKAVHEAASGRAAVLFTVHSIETSGDKTATAYGRTDAGGRCWATYYYHLDRSPEGWVVTLAVEDIAGWAG
jgi:hypothetical protein